MNRNLLFCLILAAGAASAQTREFGLIGGGAVLPGIPIIGAPAGTSAGFEPGVAAGAFLGQDLYSHWGGEIRYLFELRDPRISSGSQSTSFSGQAHVLYYDLIYKPRVRSEGFQPYIAVGGGMKLFRGTGDEEAYRPLMQYAYLTQTHQLEPMLSVGGGIKRPLGQRMVLRFEVRDQITPFPNQVIAPAPGMALKRWLNDLVPTVGLSWKL